jgi:hypothetical protein
MTLQSFMDAIVSTCDDTFCAHFTKHKPNSSPYSQGVGPNPLVNRICLPQPGYQQRSLIRLRSHPIQETARPQTQTAKSP